MSKGHHTRRFFPVPSFHEKQAPPLAPGTELTPRVEKAQELPSDPAMVGFLMRLAQTPDLQKVMMSKSNRKYLLLGYTAGWYDFARIAQEQMARTANRVPFTSASPIVGGFFG